MFEDQDRRLLEVFNRALSLHPEEVRRRGQEYFVQDRVEFLGMGEAGPEYEFFVHGSRRYSVRFIFRGDTVEFRCDCPVEEVFCKHTAAAVYDTIEGISFGDLDLSAHRNPGTPRVDPLPSNQDASEPSELGARLTEATGKKLNKNQNQMIFKVSELFRMVPRMKSGEVDGGTINRFFHGGSVPYWEYFTVWRNPPASDLELWLCLVLFARRNKLQAPQYMRALEKLPSVQEQLKVLERSATIHEWSRLFADAVGPLGANFVEAKPPRQEELRLLFGEEGTTLLWRKGSEHEFVPISATVLRCLNDNMSRGALLPLESRSELLFRRLEGPGYDRVRKSYSFDEYREEPVLSNLLQSDELEPLLLAPSGNPFLRPSAPLRWRVAPASSGANVDYQVQLVREDGSVLDKFLHLVEGPPGFVLTESEIYSLVTVPEIDSRKFLANQTIPAEAVESAGGIRLFDRLQAELPPALTEQIQRIPLRLQVICNLYQHYREECLFEVTSILPSREPFARWDGKRWMRPARMAAVEPEKPDQVIIYDDQPLEAASQLFDGLKVTWDEFKKVHRMSVSRNFPQVFSNWLSELPKEVDVQLRGELAAFADQAIVGRMQVEVAEAERDWFDLQVVLDVEDTNLTKEEIDLLLAAHGKWVRLEGKGWRRFELEMDNDVDMDFARLGLNPNELTDEPQRLHALQLANPAAQRLLPEGQAEAVKRRAEEIQTRVNPAKPRSIKADLRPYQLEGFHFLAYLSSNSFGGILADDMGLGKTLQTLTWLLWLHGQKKRKSAPTLVVCPKSVMDNWQAEAEKFAPKFRVEIWSASNLKNLPESLPSADLHVINYNQLRSIGNELAGKKFLAVILDEGQYIKNPASQTAKTARALTAEHRLVLTGTPIENRALDLWSLMAFAMPGVLGNQTQFGKLYDSKNDSLARLRLSSRVRPFLIRRTKSQVAQDLPERIEDEIHCEMGAAQKKLYEAELKRAQQILLKAKTNQQLSKLRFNFLTSLLRLRQICSHPVLFHETTRAKSAKIEALVELLAPLMEEEAKVLVFSQFIPLIQILEKELAAQGIRTWTLTGDTEDRGELVKEFQESKDPGVFLISLKAGGSGLNLTAASYVVLFDPWWNPAVEAQAIDRTHRIGQSSKIIAYRLIMKNTIEEKIRNLQREKQALVKDVLGEEQFSQALSLKDFQFLLQE